MMIYATSNSSRHGQSKARPRLVKSVLLLISVLFGLVGCQAFDGSVIEISVDLAADHQVLTDIHELVVQIRSDGQNATETFSSGEALTFPTSLALAIGKTQGEVSLDVRGREESGRAVIRGLASLEVDQVKLYQAQVSLGLSATCGDGLPVEEDEDMPPEICLVRTEPLILGGGDPNLGNIANDIRIVDINDDGLPDLAAAWSHDYQAGPASEDQSSGVSLFFGEQEGGGFRFTNDTSVASHLSHPGDAGAPPDEKQSYTDMTVADVVNNEGSYLQDGDKDLIVASYSTESLHIWPNQGTFFRPELLQTVGLGGIPAMVRTGDVMPSQVDNAPTEIVVALREVSIPRSDGGKAGRLVVVGTTQDSRRTPEMVNPSALETSVELLGFRLADLDGDGDTDIAAAAAGDPEDGEITVNVNDGEGAFRKIVVGSPHQGTRDVTTLDLDGDGDLDLATMNDDTGTVGLYHAISAGQSYSAEPDTYLVAPQGLKTHSDFAADTRAKPECLRKGDIDGDGFPDLLLTDRVFGSVFILLLQPASGGSGEALRFPPIRLPMGIDPGTKSAGGSLQGCAVEDSDGDGVIDLVVAVDRQPNLVQVLRRQP